MQQGNKNVFQAKRAYFFLLSFIFFGFSSPAVPGQEEIPGRPLRAEQAVYPDFPSARHNPNPIYSTAVYSSPAWTLLDISSVEQNLTRHYINQYSSRGGLEWLQAVMRRGEPYLEFIRREIDELNLPRELIYLPVIESAFSASALSRAGASGLWQFMRNSIAPFDMVVNEWVDERRDFWKSTRGALRKLEENYRFFGDWPLALAAYNAGAGAVNRAVNRTGIKDYWQLSEMRQLPNETINYVPKLLAASYILSNPREFGLSPLWPEDPQWVRLPVERSVDLNLLASEAGIDGDFLKWSNRELLYSITPPGQGYYLKARASDAERISAVLSSTDLPLVRYYVHTVSSGDTLLALALHYGISVDQIVQTNPGTSARSLRIGSRLMIPALKEAAPYARKPQAENISFGGTHVVRRGESLWSLAMAWDITPELLAEANGMGMNDVLHEGRAIKTPIKE